MCKFFKCNALYDVDLVSSNLLSVKWLIAFRAAFFVLHLTVAVWIHLNDLVVELMLSYISYACVSLYFLLILWYTYSRRMVVEQVISYPLNFVRRSPAACTGVSVWTLFETLLIVRFLVFVVFLALIYDPTEHLQWWDVLLHVPFALSFELCVNRIFLVLTHMLFPVLFVLGYLGVVVLVHHTTNQWIFMFLDYHTHGFTYYVVAPFLTIGVYVLCYLCALCKLKYYRQRGSLTRTESIRCSSLITEGLASPARSIMRDQNERISDARINITGAGSPEAEMSCLSTCGSSDVDEYGNVAGMVSNEPSVDYGDRDLGDELHYE